MRSTFLTMTAMAMLLPLLPALVLAQIAVVDTIQLAPRGGNGLSPASVCVNEEDNIVYVANEQSGNVTVVNGNTGDVQGIIRVGGQPKGICIHDDPSYNYVFVTDHTNNRIFVVDALYNFVTDTLSTPDGPWDICVNTETNYLYVTCFSADQVVVYNVQNPSNIWQVKTIDVPGEPLGICVNRLSNRVYVACHSAEQVSIIDGTSNSLSGYVEMGAGPRGICVNEATDMIYAACYDDGTVRVVDGTSGTLLDYVYLDGNPWGIDADPLEDRIYVANGTGREVWTVDGATSQVVDTLVVGRDPRSVCVNANPSFRQAFVPCYGSNDLAIVNLENMTLKSEVLLGSQPGNLRVDEISRRLYASDTHSDKLLAIDLDTQQMVGSALVGSDPLEAVAHDGRVFVASSGSNSLWVVDDETFAVVDTIAVGEMPWSVDVYREGNKIFVGAFEPGDVWIVDAVADTVIATVELDLRVEDVVVNQVSGRVYMTTPEEETIQVLDAATNVLMEAIMVGAGCAGICANELYDFIYATCPYQNKVIGIDEGDNEITDVFDVRNGPLDICILEASQQAYVIHSQSEEITIIDVFYLQLLDPLLMKGVPQGIDSWEDGRCVYVSIPNDGAIYVLRDLATRIDELNRSEQMPLSFRLGQNYPNPFNGSTEIPLWLPPGDHSNISLQIHNVLGQVVRHLAPPFPEREWATITWDGRDDADRIVASGLYFCRLSVGGLCQTNKMMLLR